MELCTSTRCISNRLPNPTSFTPYRTCVQWKFSLPLKPNSFYHSNPAKLMNCRTGSMTLLLKSNMANQHILTKHKDDFKIRGTGSHIFCLTGSRYHFCSIKASASDETSNQYVKEEPDVLNYTPLQSTNPDETSNGANQYVKEEPESEVTVDKVESEEKSGFGGFSLFKDDATTETDDHFPQFDLLNKLNMELDLEDTFSIALLGIGGVAALWLTVSIVGAIDNIPLFPKLMEVVGLGYTIWFSTRYLLFKKNRDELGSKVEEIKQQVLGSKN